MKSGSCTSVDGLRLLQNPGADVKPVPSARPQYLLVIVLAAPCVTISVAEPETWLGELGPRLAYASHLRRILHGMRHG